MVSSDVLSDRLLKFAADCIKLAGRLIKTYVGRHIANQLVKASSSAGANYEEARAAESKADFIHKLQVVLKELRESRFWLRLVIKSELLKEHEVIPLKNEAEELVKIFSKSVATAKRRK